MPHVRRSDQSVDAFSAPKALLVKAAREALRRGMTKSGFYRYCLAKECGFSLEECEQIARHGALVRALEAIANSELEIAAAEDKKEPYGEATPPPQNCPVSDAEKPPQPAASKPSKIQRPKTP